MIKINTKPNNDLINSYLKGDFNLFSLLIDGGENINCITGKNKSLISIVIRNPKKLKNNKKFFNKLISSGVCLKQIGWEEDLLTLCVIYQKDLYYAKKLLKNNININSTVICKKSELEFIDSIESRKEDNCDDEEIYADPCGPPILESLRYCKFEYFDFLLKNNADLEINDNYGNSIIHYFLYNFYHYFPVKDRKEIFKMMIDYGVDCETRNIHGQNVLNSLAQKNLYDLAGYFFKKVKNININSCDILGNTPLINSIDFSGTLSPWVKLLVRKQANLDAFNAMGYNAIMICMITKNIETFKFLIENGADITATNKYGENVLHTLVKKDKGSINIDNSKYYKLILKINPELLLQKNNQGLTPLDEMKDGGIYVGKMKKMIDKFILKTNKKSRNNNCAMERS